MDAKEARREARRLTVGQLRRRRRKEPDAPRLWVTVLVILALYIVVSSIVYAFRHPEKTETQRFLEIPKAMAWK